MSRRRPYSHRRQKRSLELLWPFLVLILVGVILILIVQFVMTWFDQRQAELKNKVYFYLDQGSAQVLPWGDTEWTKAYDQLVLEGDVIRMGPASRGVLKFFNDRSVRLDADTKVEIDTIASEKNEDLIHLKISSGHAWLNVEASADPLRFIVTTDNLRVTSFGTIFEVGQTDRETVRVMEGQVMVEVLENSSGREIVLDQVQVGVGQQVEITASDIEKIQARQPVSLLEALDDDWKDMSWFAWNREEDLNPTQFKGRVQMAQEESIFVPTEGTPSVVETEVAETTTEADSEEAVIDDTAPMVSITSPKSSPYTLTDDDAKATYSIYGKISSNTAKVTVTSYDEEGVASHYVLSHYEPGTTTWRYGVSYDFGNLREGRNLFTVVSQNESGVQSEPVDVIIQVPEGLFTEAQETVVEEELTEEEALEEETAEAEEETEETGTEADAEMDAETDAETVVEPEEPLTTPAVTSLNGASLSVDGRYTSSAESVMIVGTVSKSAVKVFVNDYQLSKYVSGSGQWSYVVRAEFLNYDVGLNTYTAVAEDADGNRKSFTFEIYRQAP